MEGHLVPVQLNKVWNKTHTTKDYAGGSTRHKVLTAKVVLFTRGEERDLELEDYPWLKQYYEENEEDAFGDRLVALLDEEDSVVVFDESKEAFHEFEEEKIKLDE